MCWSEIFVKVRAGKHLSDKIPVQYGLKKSDA